MIKRGRRLRADRFVRELARETRMSPKTLIYPVFVCPGRGVKSPIPSLDGQFHYSVDMLPDAADAALAAGVDKLLLFGLPEHKDARGSDAYDDDGIVQRALRTLRAAYGNELYLITDVCMCEYTDHGHCGILHGHEVDNDETLACLDRIAVSHAAAGADMTAPSDMMDGRVGSMRRALDAAGFTGTPIMSYAVKYASSFYGPFRDAAGSAPAFGDRKTYQMDFHNVREALREARMDEDEGADILMVKPAMSYGDVIRAVREETTLPLCAYSVSGEYAMIKCAGRAGLIDEYRVMCESAAGVYRAGADMLISYYAKELAGAMRAGDIG